MNVGLINNTSFGARIRFNNRTIGAPKKNKPFFHKTAACTSKCIKRSISSLAGLLVIFSKIKKMLIQLPEILTKITNIKNSVKLPS